MILTLLFFIAESALSNELQALDQLLDEARLITDPVADLNESFLEASLETSSNVTENCLYDETECSEEELETLKK